MSSPDADRIAEALSYIPADERDTWIRMAMAVKAALGDDGWGIWDAWSRTWPGYRPRDAITAWRSVKPTGGVTAGSLFDLARKWGWLPDEPQRPDPRRTPAPAPKTHAGPTHEQAAATAAQMIAEARIDSHPYLARKGFPEHRMFVRDGVLLVPMRPVEDYAKIASIQTIQADGSKKFLRGGRARGCVYHIGNGTDLWWCEGLATGLSVAQALKRLYRRSRVTVCFSAGNLSKVARRGLVIADHDARSGAGEDAAKRTGLPYWLPPEPGDANDLHLARGIAALSDELSEFTRRLWRQPERGLRHAS